MFAAQHQTVFASAARTATHSSADISVPAGARGVRVRVNVSALAATPSVVFTIQEKDSISGEYVTLLASAAVTSTGQKTTLVVYPGCAAAANAVADTPLPSVIRINAAHGDADSITYTADLCFVA